MGRAKLDMMLISKEKSRHTTFKKRKEGLIRKIHEFATLCDVKACMIIHPPPNSATETTEIWPENPDEVSRIITLYQASAGASGGGTVTSRNYGLTDFYHGRKKKIQEELEKKKKKRMEMVYPTWIDSLGTLPETQLRGFAASLEDKLGRVKSQIESMKGTVNHHPKMMIQDFPLWINNGASKDESSSYGSSNSHTLPYTHHIHEQFQPYTHHMMPYQFNNDNQENQPHSMMGLLTNENLNLDHYQLGNIAPNYNTIQVAYKQEILRYSSSSGGVVENLAGGMGFGRYHGGPLPPMMAAPPGFQYPSASASSSDVHFQHNFQDSKGKEFSEFLQNSMKG